MTAATCQMERVGLAGAAAAETTHAEVLARAATVADELAARAAKRMVPSQFPRDEMRLLADTGLLAAALPRALGGAGLGVEPGSTLGLLRLLKQVGRGDLPVGRIFEGHVNALQLIGHFGTAEQLARAADDVRAHQRIFGVWNAETAGEGVELHALGDGCYRLAGAKVFASGAGFIERPIVTGKLPTGEVQMCVVRMDEARPPIDPDWWQPLGMEATASYRVDFSGIELTPEDLIGPPGCYYRDPWFGAGAVRFTAVQLGGAERLYDVTRRYLRELHRGPDHPPAQWRAAEMAAAIESGNLWLRGGADAWEQPPDAPDAIVNYAAMMRLAIEAICNRVIALAEISVSARGLMQPYPMGRLIRDLTMYLRQPAADAVVARLGRHVLNDPRPAHEQWFDDMDESGSDARCD